MQLKTVHFNVIDLYVILFLDGYLFLSDCIGYYRTLSTCRLRE